MQSKVLINPQKLDPRWHGDYTEDKITIETAYNDSAGHTGSGPTLRMG